MPIHCGYHSFIIQYLEMVYKTSKYPEKMRLTFRPNKIFAIILIIILIVNLVLLAFAVVSVLLFWFVIAFIAGFAWWIVPKMRR